MFFFKESKSKNKTKLFSFFMGGGRGEEVGGTGVRDFFFQRMKKKRIFFSGGGRVNELFLQRI